MPDGLLGTLSHVNPSFLTSATLGGVAIPNTLLQELVSYYSRSVENPEGFNLAEPFDLPARIREVHTRRGAATVVQ
jgi:hypothetical protein